MYFLNICHSVNTLPKIKDFAYKLCVVCSKLVSERTSARSSENEANIGV